MNEDYDSRPVFCRLCVDPSLPESELIAYLDNYVRTLPEQQRVSAEAYLTRLQACSDCEHQLAYTCRKCGCYVQVRASKRAMHCPLPGELARWREEPDSE